MMQGYEERVNDEWKQSRFTAYITYCTVTDADKRKNIFDFHPLPGDPTKEELGQMAAQEKDNLRNRMKHRIEQAKKQMARRANGR